MQSALMVGLITATLSNVTSSSLRRPPGLRPTGIAWLKSPLLILPPYPSPGLTWSPSEMMRRITLWTLFFSQHTVKEPGSEDTSWGTGPGSGLMAPSGLMTTGNVARLPGRTASLSRQMVTGMWGGSLTSCVDTCVSIWIWISSQINSLTSDI